MATARTLCSGSARVFTRINPGTPIAVGAPLPAKRPHRPLKSRGQHATQPSPCPPPSVRQSPPSSKSPPSPAPTQVPTSRRQRCRRSPPSASRPETTPRPPTVRVPEPLPLRAARLIDNTPDLAHQDCPLPPEVTEDARPHPQKALSDDAEQLRALNPDTGRRTGPGLWAVPDDPS